MQPGKPIVGEDVAVYIDRTTDIAKIEFTWKNLAIEGAVDVFLVIDGRIKKKVESKNAVDDGVLSTYYTNQPTIPDGRMNNVYPEKVYTVRYYFTKKVHVDPYKKKYPVFKFRIEMVGNPTIFAETNEFKVIY